MTMPAQDTTEGVPYRITRYGTAPSAPPFGTITLPKIDTTADAAPIAWPCVGLDIQPLADSPREPCYLSWGTH